MVSGSIGADSPIFPVDTAARLHPGALANARYFFQNESNGADFIRTPLRQAPGHLHDKSAAVYLTPEIDRNDNLVGDLTPTGAMITPPAAGGMRATT